MNSEETITKNEKIVSASINSGTIERKGSIVSSLFWMMLLSILLVWLPLIGTGIAGYVGGKKAGNIGRALFASVLPTLVIFVLSSIIFGQIFGALWGGFMVTVITVVVFLSSSTLILGAIIGGWHVSRKFALNVTTESNVKTEKL